MISVYSPPQSKRRVSQIRKLRALCVALGLIVVILLISLVITSQPAPEPLPEEIHIAEPTLSTDPVPEANPTKVMDTEPDPEEPAAVYLGTYTCYAYCP